MSMRVAGGFALATAFALTSAVARAEAAAPADAAVSPVPAAAPAPAGPEDPGARRDAELEASRKATQDLEAQIHGDHLCNRTELSLLGMTSRLSGRSRRNRPFGAARVRESAHG